MMLIERVETEGTGGGNRNECRKYLSKGLAAGGGEIRPRRHEFWAPVPDIAPGPGHDLIPTNEGETGMKRESRDAGARRELFT